MPQVIPRLAITMGDPAGIGPEIIIKACRRLQSRIAEGELRLLVIGHGSALAAARAVLHETIELPVVDQDAAWPSLAFLQAGEEHAAIRFGETTPEAGRFSYLAVERAVELTVA